MKNKTEENVSCAKPLVSVVMSVYNTPKEYLSDAVKSILNQTYNNFELIIVDDCSDIVYFDDPFFKNDKIKILKNEHNRGCGYCSNKGVSFSRGKYIARMDSDDIALPSRLEKQVAFMEEHSDVVACGTWFKFFGNKSHEVKRIIDDNEYYRCCLLFSNSPTILHPSIMIRKETLETHNVNYDPTLRCSEDYNLWVELSNYGKITNLKEVLMNYRVHEKQITFNNNINKQSKPYDDIVKERQFKKLGLSLTRKEKEMFLSDFVNKKVSPRRYYVFLKKIVEANKVSQYFDQTKLNCRVAEQWETKLKHVNNPFVLLYLCFTIRHEFRRIFSIKFKQLRKKV